MVNDNSASRKSPGEGLSVLIPVFNEEGSIKGTLEKIKDAIKNLRVPSELIVIDDGSTDGTGQILGSVQGITLLVNAYNLGYGASLKRGLKEANYPWIFIVDADGTYPIEDLPKLWSFHAQYDMVVGARTGKNVHVPLLRKPAKFILTRLACFLTRKKIPDLNSGMRLFKKQVALEFFHLFPSRFSFTTTLTLACLTNDYLVKWVPINYFSRQGASTVKPINDFVSFNKTIFKVVFYFEPLRFFLWPGILLCLLGLAYGIYQVLTSLPRDLGQFPFILFLSGLQIILLGFIAELIAKSRK
ncbi:glycosyltransferase family 2 protein [Candidatus Woesearchaeota archaeon]|nr:glycosyltransferase family 2 protein [Candidatus Woesearchaeota archaeon]